LPHTKSPNFSEAPTSGGPLGSLGSLRSKVAIRYSPKSIVKGEGGKCKTSELYYIKPIPIKPNHSDPNILGLMPKSKFGSLLLRPNTQGSKKAAVSLRAKLRGR
jgi:hypothetical protein